MGDNPLVIFEVDRNDFQGSMARNHKLAADMVLTAQKKGCLKTNLKTGLPQKVCPASCNCMPQVRSSAKARAAKQ